MFDVKKIKESDVPLEKTNAKKKVLKSIDLFSETEFIVKSGNSLWQLIFCFEKMKSKVDIETLLMLMYLQNLYLFPLRIVVNDKKHNIKSYIQREFIKIDYSNNDGFYKLTEYSKSLIDDFNKFFLEKDVFLNKNRVTDIDLDSKLNSILSRFV